MTTPATPTTKYDASVFLSIHNQLAELGLQTATATNYARSIATVCETVCPGRSFTLTLRRSPELLIRWIDSNIDNVKTKRNYYKAIIKYLKCVWLRDTPDCTEATPALVMYEEQNNDLVKLEKAGYESNERTSTQAENWMSWSAILESVSKLEKEVKSATDNFTKETLDKNTFNLVRSYVLALCYTELPPRRASDFLYMFIKQTTTDDTSKNYYDSAEDCFIFNKYKTAAKYGQYKTYVSVKLRLALNYWTLVQVGLLGETEFNLFTNYNGLS